MVNIPRRDVASLLHESAQGEPQRILNREMIGQHLRRWIVRSRRLDRGHLDGREGDVGLFDAPLCAAESADDKQDDGNAQISECHAHPNFFRQRVHKAEDAGEFLHGFLDHYADPEVHKRFAKVHHSFPARIDGQRRHSQIRFLLGSKLFCFPFFFICCFLSDFYEQMFAF